MSMGINNFEYYPNIFKKYLEKIFGLYLENIWEIQILEYLSNISPIFGNLKIFVEWNEMFFGKPHLLEVQDSGKM